MGGLKKGHLKIDALELERAMMAPKSIAPDYSRYEFRQNAEYNTEEGLFSYYSLDDELPAFEKIGKRKEGRKQRANYPPDQVELLRAAYVHPCLEGALGKPRKAYAAYMNTCGESQFWDEIGLIAEEHRPREVAHLAKKRFGIERGGHQTITVSIPELEDYAEKIETEVEERLELHCDAMEMGGFILTSGEKEDYRQQLFNKLFPCRNPSKKTRRSIRVASKSHSRIAQALVNLGSRFSSQGMDYETATVYHTLKNFAFEKQEVLGYQLQPNSNLSKLISDSLNKMKTSQSGTSLGVVFKPAEGSDIAIDMPGPCPKEDQYFSGFRFYDEPREVPKKTIQPGFHACEGAYFFSTGLCNSRHMKFLLQLMKENGGTLGFGEYNMRGEDLVPVREVAFTFDCNRYSIQGSLEDMEGFPKDFSSKKVIRSSYGIPLALPGGFEDYNGEMSVMESCLDGVCQNLCAVQQPGKELLFGYSGETSGKYLGTRGLSSISMHSNGERIWELEPSTDTVFGFNLCRINMFGNVPMQLFSLRKGAKKELTPEEVVRASLYKPIGV